MQIKNIREIEKFVREATLEELKENLIIILKRIKTRQELAQVLQEYVKRIR